MVSYFTILYVLFVGVRFLLLGLFSFRFFRYLSEVSGFGNPAYRKTK